MEIEPDQQIRTKTDPLPPDEHQNIVVPQHKHEHGEHEQIQVSEEAIIPAFVRHVTGGVNVNQHANAGHKQQPDRRKGIEQETVVGLELRGRAVVLEEIQMARVAAQPGVKDLLKGTAGIVM